MKKCQNIKQFSVAFSNNLCYAVVANKDKEENKMKTLNERIKAFRTHLHLSQAYVANYLGLSRTSFTQLENGNRKATAEDVLKLSSLFGVSTDLLLRGAENSMPTTVFARSFDELDEIDKAEIMNLMQFKKQLKAQRKGL